MDANEHEQNTPRELDSEALRRIRADHDNDILPSPVSGVDRRL